MEKIRLGINLNCFSNRYPEPEEWTKIVQNLGIKYVQFNADLIDPFLPLEIQQRIINQTLNLCNKRDITICSSFGGHNHHQNYLGHPDDGVAEWYKNFYKSLINQTAFFGGEGVGTCFSIMSVKDSSDPLRKNRILERAANAYIELSGFAKEKGLKYLLFETTSVPRETCATFEETDYVLSLLKTTKIPMRLCLDVGHRNMQNPDSPEASPYEWIKRYGAISPVIHLQQTNNQMSHHWPFIQQYNEMGEISPETLIKTIKDAGINDILLALEISHKAYYPYEYQVINNLKESVNYWREWVKL